MSRSVSLVRVSALACCIGALWSSSASAQTLGGQVVQLDTKKPLAGAAVALVNDSAVVVASGAASAEGAFYLDAPSAGLYRLVLLVSGGSFVSPHVQLDSGKTIERQFAVPDVPATFSSVLFARDVTKPAAEVPGNRPPAYPAELAAQGVRALVSTMFVVSELGQPDVSTFRVLNPSVNELFAQSIRDALHRTRFVPAKKGEEWVPQVVHYTYDFGFAGDPERGDVVVRAPAMGPVVARGGAPAPSPNRASDRSPVKTMYVVTADEFAQPEIEMMNLADALHRLRPRLFGTGRGAMVASAAAGPFFVNDVRVEGMNYLRNITARDVEEVRYWKREEAAMKFGMDYLFAVTVKLRPDRS